MSVCEFRKDDGRWACVVCGWVYPRDSDTPPRKTCPSGKSKQQRAVDAAERLALDIMARIENGHATRPAIEIESRLVECRKCYKFRGDNCRDFGGCDGSTRRLFLDVLTRADRWCKRW